MAHAVATVTEERPAGFLALMRNRNYSLLWWGQLVSELGNRFHWVAVSLWVYSLTRSAEAVSLAISSMFVGGLLVSLWAGVLVDRLNRKAILITADITRAVLVALIPSLMRIDLWLVYADLALISVATAFFRPAIFSVVPTVVSRRDLLPANSFFTAMDTGTEIVGPAAAGILAFKYGYAPLLYIDASTYTVSALCILGMFIARLTPAVSESLNLRTAWNGVLEGFRYIRADRLQSGLFVLIFPAYLVGSGLNALQTPLAKGIVRVTDAEFGTFNSIWGVGFVVASLLLGWYGVLLRKSLIIIVGFFLQFAATAFMGFSTSFEALLVTGFAVGFANTLHYVGLSTVLMEHTPQPVIGRVISTRQVALSAIRFVSPLVFGVVADQIGVRQAIALMAVVGAVGTVGVLIASPAVRKFDIGAGRVNERLPGIWRVVSGPVDPELDEQQQRLLNTLSMSIVLAVWFGLLYQVTYLALGFLGTLLAFGYLGGRIRRLR